MDPASAVKPNICDACRRIDFKAALSISLDAIHNIGEGIAKGKGILLDKNSSQFKPPVLTDCVLCRLLSSVFCWYHEYWSDPDIQAETSQNQQFELRLLPFLQNCHWANAKIKGAQDSAILLNLPTDFFTTGGHTSETGLSEAGWVVCYPKDARPGLFKPQIVPESYDNAKARLWMGDCQKHHGAKCNEAPSTIEGLKLIDCKTMEVVMAELHMRWVALSYVWGPEKNVSCTKELGNRLTFAKTVRDTITVTTDLGFQYLWVDEYCIDQESAAEKADQISKMDIIYRGAELTIIAAAGQDKHHGLPGVSGARRPRQEIIQVEEVTILSTGPDPVLDIRENSKWWTRAWTFQEGYLSRRRLIFTEHQMYFQCHSLRWMEAIGGLEFTPAKSSTEWASWGDVGSGLYRYDIMSPKFYPLLAQTSVPLCWMYSSQQVRHSGRHITNSMLIRLEH